MADEHGRAQLEGLLGAMLKNLGTSDELLPQVNPNQLPSPSPSP